MVKRLMVVLNLLVGSTFIPLVALFLVNAAAGQEIISVDTIQDGGVHTTDESGDTLKGVLQITDDVNNPQLTLLNAAIRNTAAIVVGTNDGQSGRLIVQGGSTLNNTMGSGSLGSAGGSVSAGDAILGRGSNSSAEARVLGAGSVWNNKSILMIGQGGSGLLRIESGGAVSNSSGFIGLSGGSSGEVLVSGVDSTWTNTFNLSVGSIGKGILNIENGGRVSNTNGSIGGLDSRVSVTGLGSTWTNEGGLTINSGSSAVLTIQNGGRVTSNIGTVGSTANGNAIITGGDSLWTITSGLTVGQSQSSVGSLLITDGGSVTNTFLASIGANSNSSGAVTVSGVGSQWTATGELRVGSSGSGSLTLLNGGNVTSTSGSIGHFAGSSGTATISGGAIWSTGSLQVGRTGAGSLRVEDGGLVTSSNATIGLNVGSVGSAVVTGTDAKWTSTGTLTVNGILAVENGGQLQSSQGNIGGSQRTGSVTIAGAGSRWDSGQLLLGQSGGTGTLDIIDGGRVTSSFASVGHSSSFGTNPISAVGVATVRGAGSVLESSGAVWVGGFSATGTLLIQELGLVSSTQGSIGVENGSSGTVSVSGSGSIWNNHAGELRIGSSGSGLLNIENGGLVTNGTGYLGMFTTTTGTSDGTANVQGPGSQWTNTGSLYIGGTNNATGGTGHVNISDGGLVSVQADSIVWSTGQVQVGAGGTFDVAGGVTLHGSLVNNGLVNGSVNASGANSLLAGEGHFSGFVVVQDNALLSPGNSIGLMTGSSLQFSDNGQFLFEINDALGSMGAATGWDALSLSGQLDIVSSINDPFLVRISSLGSTVDNFNPAADYTWTFLSAAGGITGFDASAFAIDSSEFLNATSGGQFAIVQSGNNLAVSFSAVPEPTSLGLLAAAVLCFHTRRARRMSV